MLPCQPGVPTHRVEDVQALQLGMPLQLALRSGCARICCPLLLRLLLLLFLLLLGALGGLQPCCGR
jgi:hypothetical protein